MIDDESLDRRTPNPTQPDTAGAPTARPHHARHVAVNAARSATARRASPTSRPASPIKDRRAPIKGFPADQGQTAALRSPIRDHSPLIDGESLDRRAPHPLRSTRRASAAASRREPTAPRRASPIKDLYADQGHTVVDWRSNHGRSPLIGGKSLDRRRAPAARGASRARRERGASAAGEGDGLGVAGYGDLGVVG
ncbi:hypothetical protein [Phytohabitans rumicis]|uniref:hypothetical protein n=1 Tax=Phytohabitans rumicis TaxID=1076125 RepID=UPI0031EA2887